MTKTADKRSGTLRSKIALVLLVVFTLSMVSSCRSKVFSAKEVDLPELARLLVDSMINISDAETNYFKIPEEQREGVTFSEFYDYISLLTKMLPKGGSIKSFSIVSGDEREELISEMMENGSEEYKNIFRSCVPVKLETSNDRLCAMPIYFYIQKKDNGKAYLSRQWIIRCRDIYDFSLHYFEAYQKENLNDVITLLPSTSIDKTLLSAPSVLTAKAKEMIRFYSSNVKTDFSGYELCSVDAADLLILQPEVFDTHLQTQARYVHFSYDSKDMISVDDSITSDLKTADLYLYYNGHRAIRIGETATYAQLQTLLGIPVSVSCGPVIKTESHWGGEEVAYRNILIRYKGFAITVYGTYNDETDWEGNFIHFRIWDTAKVTIGTSISSSCTTWDVLERYPFADMTDYDLEVTLDGEVYELKILTGEKTEDDETDTSDEEDGLPLTEILLAWRRYS